MTGTNQCLKVTRRGVVCSETGEEQQQQEEEVRGVCVRLCVCVINSCRGFVRWKRGRVSIYLSHTHTQSHAVFYHSAFPSTRNPSNKTNSHDDVISMLPGGRGQGGGVGVHPWVPSSSKDRQQE